MPPKRFVSLDQRQIGDTLIKASAYNGVVMLVFGGVIPVPDQSVRFFINEKDAYNYLEQVLKNA